MSTMARRNRYIQPADYRRWAALVSLVSLASGALWSCSSASSTNQNVEFKNIPLNDFICDSFNWDVSRNTPSVALQIPKQYQKIKAPSDIPCVWATKSDGEHALEPDALPPEDGFFLLNVSRGTGFDAQRNTFASGVDEDETTMAATLRAAGYREITIKRHNVQGRPVLIIEYVLPSGRPGKLVYLAMRIGTNVIMVRYFPRKEWSEWDGEVWARFKNSLVGT